MSGKYGGGGKSSGLSFLNHLKATWIRFKSALTSNQNFEYIYWIQVIVFLVFEMFMKLLGPILVVVATGLILTIFVLFYKSILPVICHHNYNSVQFIIHGFLGLFFVVNILYNYYMCINTNPGDIEEPGTDPKYDRLHYPVDQYTTFEVSDTDVDVETELSEMDALIENNNDSQTNSTSLSSQAKMANIDLKTGKQSNRQNRQGRGLVDVKAYGFCKKCRSPRPPRTHHCHICRKCVLAMDHHCPWMNNCVGYYNYRYFLLFLMHLFTCVIYGAIILYKPFQVLLNGDKDEVNEWFPPETAFVKTPLHISSSKTMSSRQRRRVRGVALSALLDLENVWKDEKGAVFFCFLVAVVISIAVGILFFWHVYLVSTAQTTIDFYVNYDRKRRMEEIGLVYRNPYDLGIRENWALVLGKGKNLLETFQLILPSSRPPPPLSKKIFENLRNIHVVAVQEDDIESGRSFN